MTDLTKEDLQTVVREVLLERNTIGGDQHSNDHEFIQLLKDREQKRVARVEKFKMSIIGTAATSFFMAFVWLGTFLWAHLFEKGGS